MRRTLALGLSLLLCSAALRPTEQRVGDDANRIERLVGLCKLLGAVKFFHPYLAYQRIGLVPDVEVRPTIAGTCAGRDEVLEKAIEYLQDAARH